MRQPSSSGRSQPAVHVLVEEREHRLVPDHGVLRLEHPVVLVGEVEEPVRVVRRRRRMVLGELPPQPQPLADRHAVVLVAVDDEHRREDSRRRVRRVARAIASGVEARAASTPSVGRAGELVERPQARVRDDRAEPVGVPGDPVGHVAAERAAHRGRAASRRCRRGATTASVIAIRSVYGAPPQLPQPRCDEVRAVAGGERRVGQQHRVALRDAQPAGSSASSRRSTSPAGRRGSTAAAARARLRGAVRQHQPAAHARAVVCRGLDLGHRPGRVGSGAGDERGDGAVAGDAHRMRRRGPRRAQGDEVAGHAVHRDVRVGEVVGRQLVAPPSNGMRNTGPRPSESAVTMRASSPRRTCRRRPAVPPGADARGAGAVDSGRPQLQVGRARGGAPRFAHVRERRRRG